MELHFDEIPSSELETILHKRCSLPMSHCRRLVKIMLELQVLRYGCIYIIHCKFGKIGLLVIDKYPIHDCTLKFQLCMLSNPSQILIGFDEKHIDLSVY